MQNFDTKSTGKEDETQLPCGDHFVNKDVGLSGGAIFHGMINPSRNDNPIEPDENKRYIEASVAYAYETGSCSLTHDCISFEKL